MKRQRLILLFILSFSSNLIYSQFFFDIQIKREFKKTLKKWTWICDKDLSSLKQGNSVSFSSKLLETKLRQAMDSTYKVNMNYDRVGELRFYKHRQLQKLTAAKTWMTIGEWSINKNSDLLVHVDSKQIYLERRRSYNEFMDFITISIRQLE